MITYSGGRFVPNEMMSYDLNLKDVAHHLSLINRWGGATKGYYSVLEHSLVMYKLVASLSSEDHSHYFALAVLLHDAHEFILHDIPRTWKKVDILDFGTAYEALTEYVQRRIEKYLGLTQCSLDDHNVQKDIEYFDIIMLIAEANKLLTPKALLEFELVNYDWVKEYASVERLAKIRKAQRIMWRLKVLKQIFGRWLLKKMFISSVNRELKHIVVE